MSEVINAPEVPLLDIETAQPLSVGAQLKAAREAKGLKLADLAQSMKLSVRQLEALEVDNWQALPGVTFVRGFVRNYARLVELDPAPLMTVLEGVLSKERPNLALPESAPVSMPQGGPVERRDYAFALFGLALVLLAVLAYLLLPHDLDDWRGRLQATVSSFSQSAPKPVAAPVVEQEAVLPPGATVLETLHPQNPDAPADTPAVASPAVLPG
ncbi:MAG TPA: helix-turn-helix transcriptional regulator, partial [Rhodocyclaceae bacterium]|nr:helix-turn-helix transcriptional regulator [Rhodocyclaceae bacterium]